ncbi:hypothetical protein Ddc_17944 [Ditylenchus destructor]|nr:hypothetical protein Ddc_17944 [Ditylenchus destructor]
MLPKVPGCLVALFGLVVLASFSYSAAEASDGGSIVSRARRLATDNALTSLLEDGISEKVKRDANGQRPVMFVDSNGQLKAKDDGSKSLFGWKMAAGVFFVLVIGVPCCCLVGISVLVAICCRQVCGW